MHTDIQLAGLRLTPEEWQALDDDERSELLPDAEEVTERDTGGFPYVSYELLIENIPGLARA